MTQSIKGLLFDKDGTLFDFNATWGSWAAHFFQTLTKSPEEATTLATKIGFDIPTKTFDPKSVVIAGTPEDIALELDHLLPNLSIQEITTIMNTSAQTAPQAEVTPLRPFLTDLKRTYRLGVATNDAEAPARAHLNSANITDLFDFIAGYDSGFGSKPETGMQKAFCKALTLDPTEVAMIGDSTHDLISGRNAGMITIGVLTGLAPASELTPYADVVLPSIKELPEWLLGKAEGV